MADNFFGDLVDDKGNLLPSEGQVAPKKNKKNAQPQPERAAGDYYSDLMPHLGKSYQPPPQPGMVEDVARGTLAGLERGTAGLAGLPGDVLAAGRWGKEQVGYYGRKAGEALGLADEGAANRYWKEVQKERQDPDREWIMGAIPTSAAMAQLAEENIPGASYQAQTKLGRIAQTAGEFAPAAVTALIPGVGEAKAASLAGRLLPEAAKLAGAGALSEVAGQVTSGTPLEPIARIGTAIAAPIIGRAYVAPAAGGVARAVANNTGLTAKIGRTAMEEENSAALAAGQGAKYSAEELADAGLHNKIGGDLVDNKIRALGMTPQSDIARKDLIKEAVRQMQEGTPSRLSEGMIDDIIKARDAGNLTDSQIVAMIDAFGDAPSGLFNKFFNEATQARPDIRSRMVKIINEYNNRSGAISDLAAPMLGDMTNQSLNDAVTTYVKNRNLPPDLQKELIDGIQDKSLNIDDVIARANPKAYNKIWRPAYDKAGLATNDDLENILKNDSVQVAANKVYERMKRDWTNSGRRYEDFPNFLEFDTVSKKYYPTNKTPIEFWDKLGQKISDIEGSEGAETRDNINELLAQIFQDRNIENPLKKAKEQWKDFQADKNAYSVGKSFVQRIADFKRDPDARQRSLNMWDGLTHEEKLLFQAGLMNQLQSTLAQGKAGYNFWKSKVFTNSDNRELFEKITNYNAPKGVSNFDQIDNAFDMIKMMKNEDNKNLLRNTEALGPYVSMAKRIILNPSLVSGGLSGAALELLGKYALFGPTFGGASALGAIGGLATQVSKNAKARAMLDLLEERNPEKIKAFLQEVKKEAGTGKPGYWRQVKSLLDYSNKDTQKKYIEAGKAVVRSGLAGIGQQNYEERAGLRASGGRVGYRNGGPPDDTDDGSLQVTGDPIVDQLIKERASNKTQPVAPKYDLGAQIQSGLDSVKNTYNQYMGNVTEANQNAGLLEQKAVENMKSGNLGKMVLGAGQGVLAPIAGVMSPVTGAFETGRQNVDYYFGPHAANAFDVASNLGPEELAMGPKLASGLISKVVEHPEVAMMMPTRIVKPSAIEEANQLVRKGATPTDVWHEKMVAHDPFINDWLSEVDMSNSSVKPIGETEHRYSTLGQEWDNPEFYKYFPHTKNTLVERKPVQPEQAQGYFQPQDSNYPRKIFLANNAYNPREVMAHEAGGHLVQDILGFPKGDSWNNPANVPLFLESRNQAEKLYNQILKDRYDWTQQQAAPYRNMSLGEKIKFLMSGKDIPSAGELNRLWEQMPENAAKMRIMRAANEDLSVPDTGYAYRGYQKQHGENMANLAGTRLDWSKQKRQETPPWETPGFIPYPLQIVRPQYGSAYVPQIPDYDLLFKKQIGGRVKKYDDGGIVKSPDNFISPDDPQRKINFDKWRKDIRTVDEQGNPLIVYRGQRLEDQMPTKFDLRAGRSSPSFSSDPEVANVYAGKRDQWPFKPHVGKYHLGMKKPLDIRHLGEVVTLGDFIREIPHDLTQYKEHKDEKGATKAGFHSFVDAFKNLSKMREKNLAIFDLDDVHQAAGTEAKLRHSQDLADFMEFYGSPDRVGRSGHDLQKVIKGLDAAQVDAYLLADSPDVKRLLSKLGYDGIIHKDAFEGGSHVYQGDKANLEKGVDTYRPFKMTSVKSATGNRGTFNRKEADPQKEQGGRVKRATGGRIPEMDRAFFKAKRELDGHTKNLMELPDDAIVRALHIAKGFL